MSAKQLFNSHDRCLLTPVTLVLPASRRCPAPTFRVQAWRREDRAWQLSAPQDLRTASAAAKKILDSRNGSVWSAARGLLHNKRRRRGSASDFEISPRSPGRGQGAAAAGFRRIAVGDVGGQAEPENSLRASLRCGVRFASSFSPGARLSAPGRSLGCGALGGADGASNSR